MRIYSFRVMMIAAAMFAVMAVLPQSLQAASDAYTQIPGKFCEIAEGQLIESPETQSEAVSPLWTALSSTGNSIFTDSLLDHSAETLSEAALTRNLKPSHKEKGPGAKVPEPGTLFLAGAGLIGLAAFSGKAKSRAR
ncbi:MAG TPA: PEP-CTERM sorting domain-containing protein [Candidatus Binatia bacterium]|nr:PEP-CTERM sorting domain-containing protein [Candidatus Binatia bacterium]